MAELPSRQEPLQLGVLIVAQNERLPDAYELLSPTGQPGPREGRRRSLQEVVADCRAASTSRHFDASAVGWPSGSSGALGMPTCTPSAPLS